MFEQDYIVRLINEMVRMILKLVFNIDIESPTADLLEESEERAALEALLDMIDEGRIDEAENKIYEVTESLEENRFKMALLFYSHLNDKSDAFLEEHNFSRNEVKQGLMDLTSRYGLGGIFEMYFQ